jgi:Uma2 family endonuclease
MRRKSSDDPGIVKLESKGGGEETFVPSSRFLSSGELGLRWALAAVWVIIMGAVEWMKGCFVKPAVRKEDTPPYDGHQPLVVRLRPVVGLTEDQLLELSGLNSDLRLELTAEGELVVMPPAGGETGKRNAGLTAQLWAWARQDGTGTTFDSSTGFTLPNGAVRSPDASWVANSRLEALTAEQREKYLPLCPDFAIELHSPTDSLRAQQEKMREYLENGLRLGLLMDPKQRRVYVYRPGEPVRQLDDPSSVSGEPVLPGFVLDLREIW